MGSRIKQYLSIYGSFFSTSFSAAMSFRGHFVLLILMDLVFYYTHLVSIDILYDHIQTIGIWDRQQLLFFASVMLAINQISMTLVSENYWIFPLSIRTGELDFSLIKPVNAVFLSFFRIIRPGSLINVCFTGPAVVYFGLQVGLSPLAWVCLPFAVVGGFLLQNAIEMFLSCAMFWMMDGTGINFIRVELQQLARWPDFVYPRLLRSSLTLVLPVLLIGSGPVRFLLDPTDGWPLVWLVGFLGLFWLLLGFFWRLGLKAYESASS
ncbi:MAG: hypothetical protein A2600_03710 [Candidatus Lambdaproteobacteria bacterium RIFOXYD1_FULL_56_27]|uniref:ABC transporter permease n=1 Tax=Candidatus Lambdaproteobacteria bacterium RIFOXYD2_FULL_56_26 TaxID=1817773 RepID=A0A1F6H3B3_9PROT|nr:MAG: hypothetical protein A2426_11770 [Candidatus Lambdaproteobacteria bacterium RIFOXYC1_FULL_56_13]OGH04869.1 MAG: hypothetical protein A2557_07775 [Candidatus Lambdaproteobacteria bacterium RIFOXYD2_FULL_56_26]OGH09334.1 MAG: hypothetical protein A2600_03710 [Candidatus Lambdaproteobacteria bacterium RIFOXYD1_FULL_56_27]